MKLKSLLAVAAIGAAAVAGLATSTAALAQAKEQFFPALVYRTGAYAPNSVPFANGYVDYLKFHQCHWWHQRRQEPRGKSARPVMPPTAASSAMSG